MTLPVVSRDHSDGQSLMKKRLMIVAMIVSAMNLYWLGILSYLSGINAYMLPSLLSRLIFCVWLTWAAMFDGRLAAQDLHR